MDFIINKLEYLGEFQEAEIVRIHADIEEKVRRSLQNKIIRGKKKKPKRKNKNIL